MAAQLERLYSRLVRGVGAAVAPTEGWGMPRRVSVAEALLDGEDVRVREGLPAMGKEVARRVLDEQREAWPGELVSWIAVGIAALHLEQRQGRQRNVGAAEDTDSWKWHVDMLLSLDMLLSAATRASGRELSEVAVLAKAIAHAISRTVEGPVLLEYVTATSESAIKMGSGGDLLVGPLLGNTLSRVKLECGDDAFTNVCTESGNLTAMISVVQKILNRVDRELDSVLALGRDDGGQLMIELLISYIQASQFVRQEEESRLADIVEQILLDNSTPLELRYSYIIALGPCMHLILDASQTPDLVRRRQELHRAVCGHLLQAGKSGISHSELRIRNQARELMKLALSLLERFAGIKGDDWNAFITILEAFEHFELSLIAPALRHIGHLHLSDDSSDERIGWWTRKEEEEVSEDSSTMDMFQIDFSWLRTMWETGLKHSTVHVRRAILVSFFSRRWDAWACKVVSDDFVATVLLAALDDPLVHRFAHAKDQSGTGEAAVGEAENLPASIHCQGLHRFLTSFILSRENKNAKLDIFTLLMRALTSTNKSEYGRRTIAQCMKDLAYTNTADISVDSTFDDFEAMPRFVTSIGASLQRVKNRPDERHRLELTKCIIETAAILIPLDQHTFDLVTAFLPHIQPHYLSPEGPLHDIMRQWLSRDGGIGFDVKAALKNRVQTFLNTTEESDASLSCQMMVRDWHWGAIQISVPLCCVDVSAADADEILTPLALAVESIYRRSYAPFGTREKTLLLLHVLAQKVSPEDGSGVSEWLMQLTRRQMDEVVAVLHLTISDLCGAVADGSTAGSNQIAQKASLALVAQNACSSLLIYCNSKSADTFCDTEKKTETSLWDCLHLLSKAEFLSLDAMSFWEVKCTMRCIRIALESIFAFLQRYSAVEEGDGVTTQERILVAAAESTMGLIDAFIDASEGIHQTESNGGESRGDREQVAQIITVCWQTLDAVSEFRASGDRVRARMFGLLCKSLRTFEGRSLSQRDREEEKLLMALFVSMEKQLESLLLLSSESRIHEELYRSLIEADLIISDGLEKEDTTCVEQITSLAIKVACGAIGASSQKSVTLYTHFVSAVLPLRSFTADKAFLHYCVDSPCVLAFRDILEKGGKHPRLKRIGLMQLCVGLLHCPDLSHAYTESIVEIILTGENIKKSYHEEDALRVGAMRSEPSFVDITLLQAFANSEIYLLVLLASFVDELKRRYARDCLSQTAHTFCLNLLRQLLHITVTNKVHRREEYGRMTAVHRLKLRVWQVSLLLSNFMTAEVALDLEPTIYDLLFRGNLPSVRMYIERFYLRIVSLRPAVARERIMTNLLKMNGLKSLGLTSSIIIAGIYVLFVAPKVKGLELEEEVEAVLRAIFPWTTSHNHAVRNLALVIFRKILVTYEMRYASIRKEGIVGHLIDYLKTNVDITKLLDKVEDHVELYDPYTVPAPSNVMDLKGLDRNYSDTGDVTICEGARLSLLEFISSALLEERKSVRLAAMAGVEADVTYLCRENFALLSNAPQTEKNDGIASEGFNLQRKIASTAKNEIAVADWYNLQQQYSESYEERRCDLIVVASLVDKVPNLGGLARTCEVFGARQLVLASREVLNDGQFKSLAASSDRWLDIDQVALPDLRRYLLDKKEEGYSLVGLEQTTQSKCLSSFQYPDRCILVLGHEIFGLAADLIDVIDETVEIPQIGKIGSLNVHVSGAIAIWEYAKQHQL